MNELSRQEFSSIVGDIYDCAIKPDLWSGVLARICGGIGGAAGGLMVRDFVLAQAKIEVGFGTEPHWQKLQAERYGAIAPFIAPMSYLKAGQVVAVEDVMDYDVFLQGRFYKEWAAPQGLVDAMMGILARSGSKLGAIGISFKRRATDDDKQVMEDLLPHLIRAVAISDLLQFRAVEVARLSAAIDMLTTGVVFLGSDLTILDINPAAQRMAHERRIVAIENGRLLLSSAEAGRKLRAAVAICAGGHLDELKIATILLEGPDGAPGLVAHVLPLNKKNEDSLGGAAAAALFLADPEAPVRMPIETLVEQYGLSPSELRVLMGLMQGQTPREIADAHGIAMPTIRTHLRHLFEKTGTTRQMQLVKLAMSMNAPQAPTNGAVRLT
jgi:DNA-binding CsgD family transcriptional regulator